MKGTCPECVKMMAEHPKVGDWCCLKCTLTQAGLGDYMTKDEHGTVIVDLAQKIKDDAIAKTGVDNGKDKADGPVV